MKKLVDEPLVGKRLSTGIIALNHALGGGLHLPSRVAIIGTPGSGKSRLLRRIREALIDSDVATFHLRPATEIPTTPSPTVLLDGEFAVQPLRWLKKEGLRSDRLVVACVRTNVTTESRVSLLPVVYRFDVTLWIRYLTHRNLHIPEYTVVKVLKNRFGPVNGEFAI